MNDTDKVPIPCHTCSRQLHQGIQTVYTTEWMLQFDQIHSFKQESVHSAKSGVQTIKSGVLLHISTHSFPFQLSCNPTTKASTELNIPPFSF